MDSVVVKSIDRPKVEKAVIAYATELRSRFSEIERIIWFGSWINGFPTPGSDVDLCLIVSRSDLRARDRLPRYLPDGFPTGIDLLVFTREGIRPPAGDLAPVIRGAGEWEGDVTAEGPEGGVQTIAIGGGNDRKFFYFSGNLVQLLDEIESFFLKEALSTTKGNRRKAAKILGSITIGLSVALSNSLFHS